MEQLYVLGTGNATSVDSFHTCFVIKDENRLFLTDSGGGSCLLNRLQDLDITMENIHDIFISHAHMDHCLGVLWIIRVLSVRMEKGTYTKQIRIYAPQETLDVLDSMCKMLLRKKFYKMIGKFILFVPVQDGEQRDICGWEVTFFDIGSKKTLQFGYRLKLKSGKVLVFTGDEPLKASAEKQGRGADWLLREVLCCHEDETRFHAYEKKHDTVKEACEISARMQVKNAVLWHLEDKTDKAIRKQKYRNEAAKWLENMEAAPNIYIPDDKDIIDL